MKKIKGLVLIVLGVLIFMSGLVILTSSTDRDNNYFYYSRGYTLIEKNQGGHEYKGRYNGDYFFTVRYDDDKNTFWTKEVIVKYI